MMRKNTILITVLVAVCLAAILAFGVAKNSRLQDTEISAPMYGGVLALRDILTPDEYQKIVVPFLEKALEDGKMTYAELRALDETIAASVSGLGSRVLTVAKTMRPQDALAKAWQDARDGAASLGGDLSRNMRDAMDALNRVFDEWGTEGEAGKPQATPPQQAPQAPPAAQAAPAPAQI